MMKKLLYRTTLLGLVAITLSGCGMDLNEIYKSDGYNDPIFQNNYYTIYPDEILPKSKDKLPFAPGNINDKIKNKDSIVEQEVPFTVGYEEAAVFDNDISNYEWTDSNGDIQHGMRYGHTTKIKKPGDIPFYGVEKRLNKVDNQFKNGYLSKLYDGWIFCGHHFELARVQMSEYGFGQMFEKEMISDDYFAFNFKSWINDPMGELPEEEQTDSIYVSRNNYTKIDFFVNFYQKNVNEDSYNVIRVKLPLENVATNDQTDRPDLAYTFVAFSLRGLNLSRVCGYSMDYKFYKDEFVESINHDSNGNEIKNITDAQAERINYAVMLYEVFMPNSKWR